jgi:hypothetical protein
VERILSLLGIIFNQDSSRELVCFNVENAGLAGQDGLNRQGMPRLVDELWNIPAFAAGNTGAEEQNGLCFLKIAIVHSMVQTCQFNDSSRVNEVPNDFLLTAEACGRRVSFASQRTLECVKAVTKLAIFRTRTTSAEGMVQAMSGNHKSAAHHGDRYFRGMRRQTISPPGACKDEAQPNAHEHRNMHASMFSVTGKQGRTADHCNRDRKITMNVFIGGKQMSKNGRE